MKESYAYIRIDIKIWNRRKEGVVGVGVGVRVRVCYISFYNLWNEGSFSVVLDAVITHLISLLREVKVTTAPNPRKKEGKIEKRKSSGDECVLCQIQ